MADGRYESVSTFVLPDEYQRQAAEARRRRRMAEMLAQQAYQPSDISAPIPAAAPLVQGLQAFLAARAQRKADEAEEAAKGTASREARQYLKALTEAPDMTTDAVQPETKPTATVTMPQFEDGRLTSPAGIEMGAPAPMIAPQIQLSRYNLTPGQRRAAALEGMLTSENPMVQKIAGAIYPTLQAEKPKLQLGNIDPAKFTPASIATALQEGDVSKLQAVSTPVANEIGKPSFEDFTVASLEKYKRTGNLNDLVEKQKPTGGRGQAPSGYRWTPEGNLAPIPGGPANKPEGLSETARYRTEDTMRAQFERLISPLETELSQIGKITTIVSNSGGNLKNIDALSQQSLVILLNKFLDPTSVVREGEFSRVVEAQGLIGQARNLRDRILEGKPLDTNTIQQITNLANLYGRAANAKIKQYATGYQDIAKKRKLDVGSIITNPNYLPEEISDDDVEVK